MVFQSPSHMACIEVPNTLLHGLVWSACCTSRRHAACKDSGLSVIGSAEPCLLPIHVVARAMLYSSVVVAPVQRRSSRARAGLSKYAALMLLVSPLVAPSTKFNSSGRTGIPCLTLYLRGSWPYQVPGVRRCRCSSHWLVRRTSSTSPS